MLIFRNKASGKCFVYVQDDEDSKALFILPQGEAKSLKLDLFERPEEGRRREFPCSWSNHQPAKRKIPADL